MDENFFGQFLVARGVVSEQALAEALAHQRRANRPIGELGRERRYLTERNVEQVLEEQAERDLLFGELCVERKYMTPLVVSELLSIQGGNHVLLGEALQYLGHVSADGLMGSVNEFWRLQQVLKAHNQVLLESAGNRELLLRLMGRLRAAFRRSEGGELKLVDVCRGGECVEVDYVRVTSLVIAGSKSMEFALGLDRDLLRLAAGNGGRRGEDAERALVESLYELDDRVRAYFTDWIASRGLDVEVARQQAYDRDNAPEALEDLLLLEMASPGGRFILGFRADALELL